jgi:putative SOS response-associated peptidase YedK
MCLDISLHSDIQMTTEAFPNIKDERQVDFSMPELEDVWAINFPPYNIIYRDDTDSLILGTSQWGVTPFYVEDLVERKKRRASQTNIRAERILKDKKSTWYRLRKNRCLVPVTGVYEHREIIGWQKKVPYYISLKDRPQFYIPGLFQKASTLDGDGYPSTQFDFALITTAGNEVSNHIHNHGPNKHRMPLYLTEELEKEWMRPDLTDIEMQQILDFSMPSESLAYHSVYSLRNVETRPDGGHRYDPFVWENLPPLGNDHPLTPQITLF